MALTQRYSVIVDLICNDLRGYPPKVGALGEAFVILMGQAPVEMQ
jgi:hypothetical protein